MARTTLDAIKDIYDTSLTDSQLMAFMNDANLFVTEELVGLGMSAARLEAIEKYLAAHFASLRDVRTERESIGGEWSFTVQGETGMNLDATFYGQQAKLLDTTGTLDKLGANLKRASINVLTDVD